MEDQVKSIIFNVEAMQFQRRTSRILSLHTEKKIKCNEKGKFGILTRVNCKEREKA